MKIIWIVLLAVAASFGLALWIDPPAALDIWVVRKQAILFTGVASFALMIADHAAGGAPGVAGKAPRRP